jgi:hypothetical protein
MSLKILQIGLTAYFGLGLPLSTLRGLEEKLLSDTKFRESMLAVMDAMEDDSLSSQSESSNGMPMLEPHRDRMLLALVHQLETKDSNGRF